MKSRRGFAEVGQKLLSVLLSSVLVVSMVPAIALADNEAPVDNATELTEVQESSSESTEVQGQGNDSELDVMAPAEELAPQEPVVMLANESSEETVIASGGYGGYAWTLYSTGRLVQDGTSSTSDFSISAHKDSIVSVEMKTATEVQDSMFSDCANLVSFSAPRVTMIQRNAFRQCSSLASVNLPLVVTVRGNAFEGCVSLTELSFPSLENIGSESTQTSSSNYAYVFSGCTSLEAVNFPNARYIGIGSFLGCASLRNVYLPEVAYVFGRAFSGCTALESLSLPEAYTVCSGAFSGCSELKSLSLPSASNFPNGESYSYSSSRNYLRADMVAGCVSLESVYCGESGRVDAGIFQNYKDLTTVDFPVATRVDASAFEGCSSLVSVNLPKVTRVDSAAFKGCSSLSSIDLSLTSSIGASAFEGCMRLRNVTLPASKSGMSIESSAFRGCTSLSTISLPEGLKSVSPSVFENCAKLANMQLPNTVTSIGDKAFAGCANLSEVYLPSSLTSIGSEAFSDCGLTSVSVPENALTLGSSVFANCADLRTVALPSGLTALPSSSFKNCASLTEVAIPSAVSSLSSSCFEGSGLTTVVIPASVTSVASNVFGNCPSLDYVKFEGDSPNINSSAFTGTTALCAFPVSNDTWTSSYLKDYGGDLTWTPYGDISTAAVEVGNPTYASQPVEPSIAVTSNTGFLIDDSAYTVTYYADSNAKTEIGADDLVDVGTYYLVISANSEKDCTGTIGPIEFEIEKAVLTATYKGETIAADTTPFLAVEVEGFVGGETAATAAGYAPPTIPEPNPLGFGKSYTLKPSGGSADNYTFEYVSGVLVVEPRTADTPSFTTSFTYDGSMKQAVSAGEGYSVSGHAAKNAGSYEATITLDEGYAWADGTTTAKTCLWSINKAILTAAYAGETIPHDGDPALSVNVTGFVNGESPLTAHGYKAPVVTAPDPMAFGRSYTLSPAGGSATNYSFMYVPGKLTVSPKAVVAPQASTGFVYNGTSRTGVAAGEGYTLSGTPSAVDAGTYTVVAALNDGYIWSDGTTASKNYSWSIAKATPALSLDASDIELSYGGQAKVSYSYNGDGTVSAVSSDSDAVGVSVGASSLTVHALAKGESFVTVSASEGKNYIAAESVSLPVTVSAFDLSACSIQAGSRTYNGYVFDPSVKVLDKNGVEVAPSFYSLSFYSNASRTQEIPAGQIKNAGTYYVVASSALEGRVEGKTPAASFTIRKAPLTARYAGESIYELDDFAGRVTVTGFVANETAASASGYVAPVVSLPSSPKRGSVYSLYPKGGQATNYTFTYVSGALSYKYYVAVKPTAEAGLKYTGEEQVAVKSGDGYGLSGDISGTNAGSYNAVAYLDDDYAWSDGTRSSLGLNWSIAPADMTTDVQYQPIVDQVATGQAVKPDLALTFGGTSLVDGTDYIVDYEDNVAPGSAVAIATGKGNFTGELRVGFSIVTTSMELAEVGDLGPVYYTGSAVAVKPAVSLNGKLLEEDVDYTLSYSDNENAGVAKMEIKGIGVYSGTKLVEYSILPASISDAVIEVSDTCKWTGSALRPSVTVKLGDTSLAQGRDYMLSYSNNVGPGVALVQVTGRGNYQGQISSSFTIMASLSGATMGVIDDQMYTGEPLTPKTSVRWQGQTLEESVDYVLSYENNTSTGIATVIAAGKGFFEGTVTRTFVIKADISEAVFEPVADRAYTGRAIEPEVELLMDDARLVEGTDYELSYENNIDPGMATITVTGIGDYLGTTTVNFRIARYDITNVEAYLQESIVLLKMENAEPKVVALSTEEPVERLLQEGKDYELRYEKSDRVGQAKAVLTGVGDYCGTLEIPYEIVERIDISAAHYDFWLENTLEFYTGEPIEPAIIRYQDPENFVLGEDYTVRYLNNINKGTATAIVEGINDYCGTIELDFVIVDKANYSISSDNAGMLFDSPLYYKDGWFTFLLGESPVEPKVHAYIFTELGTKDLVEGEHFVVTYSDNTRPGIGEATVTGINGLTGSISRTFKIVDSVDVNDLYLDEYSLEQAEYLYTGQGIRPKLYPVEDFVEGIDYILSYKNNVNVGKGTVTVHGQGRYTGRVSIEFDIVNQYHFPPIGDCLASDIEDVVYTGEPHEPSFSLKDVNTGETLHWGDYYYQYVDNVEAGTAKVVVSARSMLYQGSKTIEFEILPADISAAEVSEIGYQVYSGEAIEPDLALVLNGEELVEGEDYSLSYANNVEAGIAKAVVEGKNNYAGIIEVPFDIVPTSLPFSDVSDSDWFVANGALGYAVSKGLMNGMGGGLFVPNGQVTRAQAATLLYNMAGQPEMDEYADGFTDVAEGAWYYKPIMWARSVGVVSGMGEGLFCPENIVTRAQFATMLRSYAVYQGIDVTCTSTAAESMADWDSVAVWARESMLWAVDRGILSGFPQGDSFVLRPDEGASRAQAAQMVTSFHSKVLN